MMHTQCRYSEHWQKQAMPKHFVQARKPTHGCIETLDNGARTEPTRQRIARGTMHANCSRLLFDAKCQDVREGSKTRGS